MERTRPAPGMAEACAALERTFGYPAFRGVQEPAVRAVLEGRDALILMPTGGGKSLCYQVPALVLPGLTLVVSPLISLMKDQVDALTARGVPAAYVNSSLPGPEIRARLDRAGRGELKLLYIAPERFTSPDFRERLPLLRVDRLAIDEAHCVSDWGRDFRPAYLRLGAERQRLGCPIIALTATATPAARADIVFHLRLRRPVVLAGGFDRPNLDWRVDAVRDERERDHNLLRRLQAPRAGAAIVYAPTRRRVDAIADLLNRAGIRAAAYHAGADAAERQRLQDQFMREPAAVLVATNAFGMGIDKPNVRLVVHHAMPGNLEAYYQEAGRAGRDGDPATCVLLHAHADRFTHDFLLDQAHPPPEAVRAAWTALVSGRAAREPTTLGLGPLAQHAGLTGGGRQALAVVRALERTGHVRVDQLTEDGRGSGSVTLECSTEPPPAEVWTRLREEREHELVKLLWMQRYARHAACRRAFMLRYFGEESAARRCGGCDRCTPLRQSAHPATGARIRFAAIRDALERFRR